MSSRVWCASCGTERECDCARKPIPAPSPRSRFVETMMLAVALGDGAITPATLMQAVKTMQEQPS